MFCFVFLFFGGGDSSFSNPNLTLSISAFLKQESDEANTSMPVEDERLESLLFFFLCESKDQVDVKMCRKNLIQQYVKVGYDVSERSVYAELSPGTDFDPKQLESLKKEVR